MYIDGKNVLKINNRVSAKFIPVNFWFPTRQTYLAPTDLLIFWTFSKRQTYLGRHDYSELRSIVYSIYSRLPHIAPQPPKDLKTPCLRSVHHRSVHHYPSVYHQDHVKKCHLMRCRRCVIIITRCYLDRGRNIMIVHFVTEPEYRI